MRPMMGDDDEIAITWSAYVNQVLDDMSDTEASERCPLVSPRTFANWRSRDKCRPPDLRRVAAFADAFGRSRVEALAAAGLPVDAEISAPQPAINLDQVSTAELLEQQRKITETLMQREIGGRNHPLISTRGRRRRRHRFTYDPGAAPL